MFRWDGGGQTDQVRPSAGETGRSAAFPHADHGTGRIHFLLFSPEWTCQSHRYPGLLCLHPLIDSSARLVVLRRCPLLLAGRIANSTLLREVYNPKGFLSWSHLAHLHDTHNPLASLLSALVIGGFHHSQMARLDLSARLSGRWLTSMVTIANAWYD